jgi:hypothetical protein
MLSASRGLKINFPTEGAGRHLLETLSFLSFDFRISSSDVRRDREKEVTKLMTG